MSAEITQLLQRHHQGDRDAFDRMVPLVYDQLRTMAHCQLQRDGPRGPLLDTSSLVQEASLQLVGEHDVDWCDRGDFFAICARAMRRIMVDPRSCTGPRLREDHVNFRCRRQAIFSAPPMYPRSASGTVMLPSAFW